MENTNTTIAISKEVKEKISEFGNKGESYSDILLRLYNSAVQRQLHDLLFNEEGCVPVKDALERARKKWHK
jgi:predicted CopG family antitoxin